MKLELRFRTLAEAKQLMLARLYPAMRAAVLGTSVWVLTLGPETRTQQQNRLMWPLLLCFSKQLHWPVNGQMVRMSPDEWKDVLTAAFQGEHIRLAAGLNGGVVMLGMRTSRMSKTMFAEWIEFLYATAADRGVHLPAWTEELPEWAEQPEPCYA